MNQHTGKNSVLLSLVSIRKHFIDIQRLTSHFCGLREAESLIDNAIRLKAIGGVYSNQRPTEFICLLLKLLQIQPEKEILVEYLLVEEFKYVK